MNKNKLDDKRREVLLLEYNKLICSLMNESLLPEDKELIMEKIKLYGNLLDENPEREEEQKRSVSPDTLIIVGANLLGIILILKYEKLDIISSKALSFVLKGRV